MKLIDGGKKKSRREQLMKQPSEDRVSTHIEIIYNPEEEQFEMHEIEDDPESESWFIEKFTDNECDNAEDKK